MPLERIHSYHVVRVLRVTIPIILLGLVGVLLWNYRQSPADQPSRLPLAPRLVEDIAELAEQIRFSQTEGGKTTFTVEARSNLGYQDGRNLLEDVIVTLFDVEDSGLERRIQGDLCGYDEQTRDIQCSGSAELQLDPDTFVRTATMNYDHVRRVISTLDAAQISRSGQFEGRADRMVVFLEDNVLEVSGGVRIVTADGAVLAGEFARYDQDLSTIEAEHGLRMENDEGSVLGSRAEVKLDPISLDLRYIRVLDDVSAQLDTGEDRLSLKAEELSATVSGGRIVEVQAEGRAVLESRERAQVQASRTLGGERLDAHFDSSSRLSSVEATGGAEMVLAGGERLTSEWIQNELSGTVSTAENSRLEVGEYLLEGSYFVVEQGEQIRFKTDRPASMKMLSGSSGGLQTEAEFSLETRAILSLVHIGEAEFMQGGRIGKADRAELRSGGNRVFLAGNASVQDAGFQIDATEIILDQEEESFVALGTVRTLWSESSEPVLVLSGQAEGEQGRISFSERAELWSGNTHILAESIDVDPEQRSLSALGEVVSEFDDLRFWSDRMAFEEQSGLLRHVGNVRALSDDIELTANEVEVVLENGETSEIVAVGNVRLNGQDFNGSSDRAVYVRATGTITLTGENAEVLDATNGMVRGCRLVFNVESRDAFVDSETNCRVLTRRSVN